MSLLVVSLDNTILNVALPTIVRSLHASSSELQWMVDAYAVVFAGLLLVMGSLGDRVGRKSVFLAGLLVFAAGSAASAMSSSPDRLIVARAAMGIGAAAIMPSTLSILTNVFTDPSERGRAIALWSGTTGLGIAIGPIAGGWLLAHYWWGSVFLVNVPIALAGLVAGAWLVPQSSNSSSKRPDPLGGALSVVGLGLLLWGVIEAPTRGWTSPEVLAAVLTAFAVLSAFVIWERCTSHPMLEISFFDSRRFSVAIGAMAMLIFALMGTLFLLTQYLQFSLGYSPLQTGVRVVPVAGVLLVAAPLSNAAVRRLGTKPVVGSGMALVAIGLGMLSTTTIHSGYIDALPALLLMGYGIGLAFAPCTDSVMGSLPLDRAGVGAATNGASLQTGGALGVGILGSLLNWRYQAHLRPKLAPYPVPASITKLITGSLGGALGVAEHIGGELGATLAASARQAFVTGMDLALLVGAIVVGVSFVIVIALLPNRPSPPRRLIGEDIPRTVEAGTPSSCADQREPHLAPRVVHVGVDEHHPLPRPENHASVEHGKHQ